MNVVREYISIDTAAAVYNKSSRTIRRKLETNPQINTSTRSGKIFIWMPALHAAMMKPVNKGGRPKGSARPRFNTPV